MKTFYARDNRKALVNSQIKSIDYFERLLLRPLITSRCVLAPFKGKMVPGYLISLKDGQATVSVMSKDPVTKYVTVNQENLRAL